MERLSDLQFNISDDMIKLIEAFRVKPRSGRYAITIIAHVRGQDFAVIDSSIFPPPFTIDCPDQNDKLSALVAAMRNSGVLRSSKEQTTPTEERLYDSIINDLHEKGYVFFEDLDLGLVPVVLCSGELVIIMIQETNYSTIGAENKRKSIEYLFKRLEEKQIYTLKNKPPEGLAAE